MTVKPLAAYEKLDEGMVATVIKFVLEATAAPTELVAVSVTENTPADWYTTTGLGCEDVDGVPPGNCQRKEIALGDDSLVKDTANGAQPEVTEGENAAVGAVLITVVLVDVPQGPVTVRITV